MNTIRVGIVTEDPFFSFMSQAILGRDRITRIYSIVPTLEAVLASDIVDTCDVLICDLDSLKHDRLSFNQFIHFVKIHADKIRILCLVQTHLHNISPAISDLPIRALIAKSDLGYYCLHILVHILMEEDWVLVSDKTRSVLEHGSFLQQNCRTMRPEREFPHLSDSIMKVVYWRVFLGLDNPDIADELALANSSVRDYMSTAYGRLGVKSELEVFEVLTQWYRDSRFEPLRNDWNVNH